MTAVYCSGFLLLLCLLTGNDITHFCCHHNVSPLLFFCYFTAAECDLVVFATVGYNVTLPCKYDVQANGLSSTCWERGAIPTLGCSNQLIASDGATVRKDSQGDVSMTILNVSEMYSGQYGCRVEIAGWWNDLKHHFKLRVQKGEFLLCRLLLATVIYTKCQFLNINMIIKIRYTLY
uniref:Immunoglobulin domain-containing protein n=1 Tax=Gadus morhua TaxID=8049 RepID=A0A8C4ZI35_GADMO